MVNAVNAERIDMSTCGTYEQNSGVALFSYNRGLTNLRLCHVGGWRVLVLTTKQRIVPGGKPSAH